MLLSNDELVVLKVDLERFGHYTMSELILLGEAKSDAKCVGTYIRYGMRTSENDVSFDVREVCVMGAAALGATGLTFAEFFSLVEKGQIAFHDLIASAIGVESLYTKDLDLPEQGDNKLWYTSTWLNDVLDLSLRESAMKFKEWGK